MDTRVTSEERNFHSMIPAVRRQCYAVARARGLSADDAEDVAQETLLRLLTHIQRGRSMPPLDKLLAYASVTAANVDRAQVRASMRRERREFRVAHGDRKISNLRRRPGVLRPVGATYDLTSESIDKWLMSDFVSFVRRFSATQAQALDAILIQGMTVRETAQELDVTRQAVRETLARARVNLMRIIDKEMLEVFL